ncbi:hypothetical protein POX_a00803 [Penicillium oxalicum]|uniref:Aminotransferase class I/classII large domain-containing protein n=1 Tax=Penicillium oxalicum (strain 114-2 / CGMCC 5302) TaxID=933388 RepID=S7ZUW4_PENO1|nr:hypothetical protein POX_a00803 [Penicillium oxalicum]EPS34224.1 hypothetical protein PDE_09188 [Penicillium oxalicum 114-2]KAI2794213.1 hypothetical protein POX_a00803 [Penicillium oxalicum]
MSCLRSIDLFRGWPAPELVPVDSFKEAAVQALSDITVSNDGFGYGPDEGYMPLREKIARWLTQFYNLREAITSNRICITGGASQNLSRILEVFSDPLQTKMIWLAEPTYHLVFQIFEDAGFYGRMKAIPEDEFGMDVCALERVLAELPSADDNVGSDDGRTRKPCKSPRKIYQHMIYCVPSFSNPSGTTMTISRRESLVRIARKLDALIICDDVYDFLAFSETAGSSKPVGAPLPRLVDIDRHLDGGPLDSFGNVVSNGSFSKLLAPGCRVGWAEATESFVYALSQAGQTKSGGAPSHLMSTFVNELLKSNSLQQHISTKLVPRGRQRFSCMISSIRERLVPLGVTFMPDPERTDLVGGYYVWLKLPITLHADRVCQEALERQNLLLGNGSLFAVPGRDSSGVDLHRSLRLCFMWEDEEHLVEGVSRLAIVIENLLTS